jgi:uncharacterized protein YdeI (YjbR/CyaY-like superfamily)
MEITKTLHATNRKEWRKWLQHHHDHEKEIWLVYSTKGSGKPRIPYLDAVEEAICFGWIDGIEKKMDADHTAQRFTPRRANSNWTELNKERARRLIADGKMTKAGEATLPDLSLDAFKIAPDILKALKEEPQTWENFQNFPDVYQRIRIGYIEEMRRRPDEFRKRLNNFLKKTKENKLFGVMK